MQEFGARLRNVRKKRKLTQEQLAERASIIRTMVCRYESENQIPTVEVLVKLADALDVSIDYLLGRTNILDLYKHGISEDDIAGELLTTDMNPSAEKRKKIAADVKHAIQEGQSAKISSSMPSTPEELEEFVRNLVKKMSDQ